jgi:hypothetical protein
MIHALTVKVDRWMCDINMPNRPEKVNLSRIFVVITEPAGDALVSIGADHWIVLK